MALTPEDIESYRDLAEGMARVSWPRKVAFAFRGSDALNWLQGQVSNDLRGMEVGDVREACFLSATGHLRAMVTVGRLAEYVVVTTEAEREEFLLGRVEESVFLEDVRAERLPLEVTVLAGPLAAGRPLDGGFVLQPNPRVPRWEVWESGGPSPYVGSRIASDRASEAFRIEHGIPKWGVDATEKTLLPELGPAFTARNVSYEKGCYLGQEVVMRIHSRGHTNKSWVALLCEETVETGQFVSSEKRENAGVVTSAAESPEFGPIAAALLFNDSAEDGTQVRIAEKVDGTVRPMPLRS